MKRLEPYLVYVIDTIRWGKPGQEAVPLPKEIVLERSGPCAILTYKQQHDKEIKKYCEKGGGFVMEAYDYLKFYAKRI